MVMAFVSESEYRLILTLWSQRKKKEIHDESVLPHLATAAFKFAACTLYGSKILLLILYCQVLK